MNISENEMLDLSIGAKQSFTIVELEKRLELGFWCCEGGPDDDNYTCCGYES